MIGSLMYLTASRPNIMFAVSACSRHQVEAYSDSDYAGSHGDRKSITGGCQFLGKRLISWQCKKQTVVATSSTEAEYVAVASCCGQVLWIQNQMLYYGFNFMNTKIFIDNQSTICIVKNLVFHQRTKHIEIQHHFIRDAHEKNLIQAGLQYCWSYIRYALTHRPRIVFDSLVKQFWATTTVHNHEAWPSEIIATIDGNEVVVTESLIRTQLQLNDVNGLYEFTFHDVLDGMREIGYPTDGSGMIRNIRPIFDFTAKLFSNMKLNWDGPHMPLLAPMLVVLVGGDGADAVAAGAAAAHDVPPPLPPPIVPPTHSSSFTLGPSTAAQATSEPTPDSPRPPTPPPYPRSEEVGPTTSTRPPSPTRQTSFQEDISEGGDTGHAAAEVSDDTTMPFKRTSTTRRHLRKPFTSSASKHFQENIFAVEDILPAGEGIPAAGPTIPAGEGIPTGSTTIHAGSSIDPTV
nr:putative ribonuclease H-like domain-containing protein [Tanacetum cinerariifolium]